MRGNYGVEVTIRRLQHRPHEATRAIGVGDVSELRCKEPYYTRACSVTVLVVPGGGGGGGGGGGRWGGGLVVVFVTVVALLLLLLVWKW